MKGVLFYGKDILEENNKKLFFDQAKFCQAACYGKTKCKVWSYDRLSKRCLLKTGIDFEIPSYQFISGSKTCPVYMVHENFVHRKYFHRDALHVSIYLLNLKLWRYPFIDQY